MIDKQIEIKVHSQMMLSLSDELNQIADKLFEGEYYYDKAEEYYQSVLYGCTPSYALLYDTLAPLNYPNLSGEAEYSVVNANNLWVDYKNISHYGEVIKCKELVAFCEKLLAFIKDEAPECISDLTYT